MRLIDALRTHGLKQVQVARESGIHHTTLSLWLSGKCKGSVNKIEAAIENWLSAVDKRRLTTPVVETACVSRFHRITRRRNRRLLEDSALVPIRLDITAQGRRLREILCWDIAEPHFTPQSFAELLVEDLSLPKEFTPEISASIEQRVSRHEPYKPAPTECLKDLVIDIRVDNIWLRDRFLWDINDPSNDPEGFAEVVCADLGLTQDVATAFAHAIREQVMYYRRIESRKSTASARLTTYYRSEPYKWEPVLQVLSPERVRLHES
jgi:SWI/SNF-related matrix-associated actin-dependent regulator of chromatin subfamily B protein 1